MYSNNKGHSTVLSLLTGLGSYDFKNKSEQSLSLDFQKGIIVDGLFSQNGDFSNEQSQRAGELVTDLPASVPVTAKTPVAAKRVGQMPPTAKK